MANESKTLPVSNYCSDLVLRCNILNDIDPQFGTQIFKAISMACNEKSGPKKKARAQHMYAEAVKKLEMKNIERKVL